MTAMALFYRIAFPLARRLDLPFAYGLSYERYERLQARLGFPIMRLRFRRLVGYWPNTKEPRTYREKLFVRQLRVRDPRLVVISDKLRVRDYIREALPGTGAALTVPLLAVLDGACDLDPDALPHRFVIKTNFGCDQNIFIRDKAAADWPRIRSKLDRWMRAPFRVQELQWFVPRISRKILVEEFLEGPEGGLPWDYKFCAFKGKVKHIQVDAGRFQSLHRRTFYDREWNKIPVTIGRETLDADAPRPPELAHMIEMAETLAAGFDFMRVDFYIVRDGIFIGEMTPYPAGVGLSIRPSTYDELWGTYL